MSETVQEHRHRRAKKKDFAGKTIKKVDTSCDNIWKFWFTDGTSLAIQSELHCGCPIIEICELCTGE